MPFIMPPQIYATVHKSGEEIIQSTATLAHISTRDTQVMQNFLHQILAKLIIPYAVTCFKCETYYSADTEQLAEFAQSEKPFDPKDWICPDCLDDDPIEYGVEK